MARPYIDLPDGTRSFRQPTDTVVIAAYYGTDIGGARFVNANGDLRERGAAAELLRPDAEAMVERIKPAVGFMGLHLWIVRTEPEPAGAGHPSPAA